MKSKTGSGVEPYSIQPYLDTVAKIEEEFSVEKAKLAIKRLKQVDESFVEALKGTTGKDPMLFEIALCDPINKIKDEDTMNAVGLILVDYMEDIGRSGNDKARETATRIGIQIIRKKQIDFPER